MQDAKNLELVHNMLKLDVEVDLNTRLLNELMLAYACCDMPDKSMEIFRDILQSEEGPSTRTILAFFRMCEKHHHGTQEAMRMMDKVKLLEIEADRRLYTAYVEALAAQCEFELATQAINKMQEEIGYSPTYDSYVIFPLTDPLFWRRFLETLLTIHGLELAASTMPFLINTGKMRSKSGPKRTTRSNGHSLRNSNAPIMKRASSLSWIADSPGL
jgi:hypothetical protein